MSSGYLAKRRCQNCGHRFKPKHADQGTCGRRCAALMRERTGRLQALRGDHNARPGRVVAGPENRAEKLSMYQGPAGTTTRELDPIQGYWRARPIAGSKPLSELERRALALEPVGLERETAVVLGRL